MRKLICGKCHRHYWTAADVDKLINNTCCGEKLRQEKEVQRESSEVRHSTDSE